MRVTAKNLTDAEKEEFVEEFYFNWNSDEIGFDGEEDKLESPYPWGAPWLYDENIELHGNTIKKMAENFYEQMEPELQRVCEEWKGLE